MFPRHLLSAVLLSIGCQGQHAVVATDGGEPALLVPPMPTGVVAHPGTGEITVEWDPVPGATGYAIVITLLPQWIRGVTSPTKITGLENGQPYYVSVAATNAAGDGVPSQPVLATPGLPGPQALVAAAGDGAVVLYIDPLPTTLSCPTYEIYWAASPGVTKDTWTSLPRSGQMHGTCGPSFRVDGLANGTAYHFTYAVHGIDGRLTLDAPETVVTPAAGAVAPFAMPAAHVYDTSAELHGEILNPAGQTTQVRFEYGPTAAYGSIMDVVNTAVAGVIPVQATVSGLQPDSDMHFRVAGQNSAGTFASQDQVFHTVRSAQTVLTNLSFPRAIAVDASWLYWADSYVSGYQYYGGVYRAPKDGSGTAVLLAPVRDSDFTGIAIAGTDVVWSDQYGIYRMPSSGGTPAPIVTARNSIVELRVQDANVVWREAGGIYRAPLAGGEAVPLWQGSYAYYLQTDPSWVYWSESNEICKMPLAGGGSQPTVLANVIGPQPTALANGSIFFVQAMSGIASVPVNGGVTTMVVPGETPQGLITDGASLYWFSDWVLRKVAISGGTPQPLAASGGYVTSPALVDEASVYWISGDWPPSIRRTPK